MKVKVETETTVGELIDLEQNNILQVNHEYQRGLRWTDIQKRMFIDSIFRGYSIPGFYFHEKQKSAGGITNTYYDIVDGQQRINAIYQYSEGAFALLDPADDSPFRFPTFVKDDPCPWGGKRFSELSEDLRLQLTDEKVTIHKIVTDNENSIRDLFIRLQGGTPLNPQEKRDSWPGNFTDFVLKTGGKREVAKWPGMPLFIEVAKAGDSRRRQLAAQTFMLFWYVRNEARFVDIKSRNIDEFYHEHVGFDESSTNAREFEKICTVLHGALDGQPKLAGHYLIHLVLFADMLRSEYAQGWASHLGSKLHVFDCRRDEAVKAEKTGAKTEHVRYYTEYGRWTQTQADIGSNIRRRHVFFVNEMLKLLDPRKLDPNADFSELERKVVFFRDREECQWCRMHEDYHKVSWQDCEIHHVLPHSLGGPTDLSNAALVHRDCHPRRNSDVESFGRWWRERIGLGDPETQSPGPSKSELPQDGTQAKFSFQGKAIHGFGARSEIGLARGT